MNTLSRQVARRRATAARLARQATERQNVQPLTGATDPAPANTLPGTQGTPESLSEAPTATPEVTTVTNAKNAVESLTAGEEASAPVYPTDWKTEEFYELPHITLYQEEKPLATLPVETFLEIAEDVAVKFQPVEERTDHWVISAPEDPTIAGAPHLINLMDGVNTKYQLAIDEELATALYSIVKSQANIPDEKEKGWFAWARRNKRKAYALYGLGGVIIALFLYNSIVSFISPIVGN